MQIFASAQTDTGRTRSENQDTFLIDEDLGLYIVCDGMGGHAAGEIASNEAAQLTAEILREHRQDIHQAMQKPGGASRVMKIVSETVHSVCHRVFEMATQDAARAGMGTTLTMLLVVSDKAIMAHVGDSRLYLLRSGTLHQLTNDHTLANELIQTGRVAAGSAEAARFNHVLTRSVGNHESVDVETLLFDVLPSDRFLLCSDGLSNYFTDHREVSSLLSGENPEVTTNKLTELANERGGTDNITSMVLDVVAELSASREQSAAILDALESSFLCRGLKLSRRMRVAGIGQLQSFGANEFIIEKGDERLGMYVVVNGSCVMTRPSGTTSQLTAGDCFGENGLARGDRFHIRVRSDDPSTVLFLPRDEFRSLVRRLPKLGRRLLDNLLDHISFQYDELLDDGAALAEFGVWRRDEEE